MTMHAINTIRKEPQWLTAVRAAHQKAYDEHGKRSQKNERWKYTDLSCLSEFDNSAAAEKNNIDLGTILSYRQKNPDTYFIVVIDGYLASGHSDLMLLPEQVTVCSMQDALMQHEDLLQLHFHKYTDAAQYPFVSLNTASFTDGLFIHVPDHVVVDKPLHILSLASANDVVTANVNNMFIVGAGSRMSVTQQYAAIGAGKYFNNIVTTIVAQENAQIDMVKLQHENEHAVHMENYFIRQKKYSKFNFTNISTGGRFSRDDLLVSLDESGAECRAAGFYHASRDGQYIDNHVTVDHLAANTASEMHYKGIADNTSRAVFNGRLYVQKDAQKINAHQENHNLLLSGKAEVYSKPELEIYADDVKCKHGATTGQIDQEALFYMRARGIEKSEATKILLSSFAEEVLMRINDQEIKQQARQQVEFL